MIGKINFKFNDQTLAGIQYGKNPHLLFIHGAGQSIKERLRYLAEKLLNDNISSFVFDHSGHGESTGILENSSLATRYNEAKYALNFLDESKPISVCGSSMGGYLAIKLLKDHPIQNLILFCPAIYDHQVFNIPFNKGFSEIIRKPESWKNSDAMSLLKNFKGNLLIFIGENDRIIPDEVIESIDRSSINTNKKEIIRIPGCPHMIHPWIALHKHVANNITDKIKKLLNT